MRKDEDNVLLAFAMFQRTCDLVKVTGLSKPTVVKYKKDNVFMHKVEECRKELMKSAVYRMEGELGKTVGVLCRIRDDKNVNPQVRVSACNSILNHYQSYKLALDVIGRIEVLEQRAED